MARFSPTTTTFTMDSGDRVLCTIDETHGPVTATAATVYINVRPRLYVLTRPKETITPEELELIYGLVERFDAQLIEAPS